MTGPLLIPPAVAGDDAAWTQSLFLSDGITPFTGYTGTETFACALWPGGGEAAITPGLAAAWISGPLGTYTLTAPAATTLGLVPGVYRVLVEITGGGVTRTAFLGRLEVVGRPGSTVAKPTYGSCRDIIDRTPWIGRLADPEDTTGFGRERGLARERLDDCILRHYRSDSLSFNAYPVSLALGGRRRTGQTSPYLSGLLVANKLMLTAHVLDVVRLYATGYILEAQVKPDAGNGYAEMAAAFITQAEDRMSTLTAELDIDGDGIGDITVDLGGSDSLWG
jgi:hypothetical protein